MCGFGAQARAKAWTTPPALLGRRFETRPFSAGLTVGRKRSGRAWSRRPYVLTSACRQPRNLRSNCRYLSFRKKVGLAERIVGGEDQCQGRYARIVGDGRVLCSFALLFPAVMCLVGTGRSWIFDRGGVVGILPPARPVGGVGVASALCAV